MDQSPERGSRVDRDTLMLVVAAAVSGVIAYTTGSGLFVAAITTVLVGWLAFAGIALLNHFRKDR